MGLGEVERDHGLMVFLVVLGVLVLVALGAGAVALATRARKDYAAGNQVVPGTPTRAPASWAGSHDPEARLHRRLRDAMAALRANQSFDDDGSLLDLRVELEHQALALDDQLVATAALAPNLRERPLAQLTEAVTSIEATVAELVSRTTAESRPALEATLERARERTSLVDQIRAELDRLPAEGPAPSGGSGEPPPPPPPAPEAAAEGDPGSPPATS